MPDETRHDERATDARPTDAEERERAAGTAGQAQDAAQRESAVGDGDGSDAAEVEQDLDALLADVKRERDEYLGLAKRARADFENYRRRAAREAQEAERRGKAQVARELLPALDNLERALRSSGLDPLSGRPEADPAAAASGQGRMTGRPPGSLGAEEAAGTDSFDLPSEEVSGAEALARGVALVYNELRAALERTGVETYDPTGEPFDPATSEALATRPADGGTESGRVIETLERGYRLDGQILRAARVVVSE
jgi:molecular chaperone GrpE